MQCGRPTFRYGQLGGKGWCVILCSLKKTVHGGDALEQYQKYIERTREANRKYREKDRAAYNEMTKLRMRKYRARKRMEQMAANHQ